MDEYNSWAYLQDIPLPSSVQKDIQGILESPQEPRTITIFQQDGMNKLIDWIFGPQGMESVELVAFGDFSCRGRYLSSSFFLRRVDDRTERDMLGGRLWDFYRRVKHSNRIPRLEMLLEENRQFLESAPSDTLLATTD
jgi:hypothetical protein